VQEETTVRLCGLKFKRQCPLEWDNLVATTDSRVRHCQACDRDVYFCATDEETMAHADQGHCVARSAPHPSELPMMVLGHPDAEWLRAHRPTPLQQEAGLIASRESRIDAALDNLRYASRRCSECGYPVPPWWRACRVCGGTDFRDAPTTPGAEPAR
jgi:hypothetical protein